MKLKLFDSAYPGSMFEKPEGSFVEFNDVDSLAAALVKNYDNLRLSLDDWADTAIKEEKRAQLAEQQRDELLAALKDISAIKNKMDGGDWDEIEEARNIAKAAISKCEA